MVGNRYRLSKPTVGVRESSQGQVLHTLLLDSIVSVRSFSDDGRSVYVDSEEVSLTLFTHDLLPFAALVAAPEKWESIEASVRSTTQQS